GTLPLGHGEKADAPVFCTGPYAADQLRRDANEPSIRVIVRGTGLATHRVGEIISESQSSSRSRIHHVLEHIHHDVGAFAVQYFGYARGFFINGHTVLIFHAQDVDGFYPYPMIDKR